MEIRSDRDLTSHGILDEASDIRAHVAVFARKVYVFRTLDGVSAIAEHRPPKRDAYQPDVEGRTATGFIVKPEWIRDLRILRLLNWPVWEGFSEILGTSEKGRRAVEIVCRMLGKGRFPLWIAAAESDDRSVQIRGTDIVVCARQRIRIQVKCDYRGGTGHPMCTGNLYLQTAERNPLKHT